MAASLAGPALPATPEENKARAALAHATVIETAFATLSQHILRDSTGLVTWTGAAPPATTGWRADWTERGLGARYCGDVLLVHATRDSLKGIGEDQRSIRLAAHLQSTSLADRPAPLHWLASGIAEGELGRESVTMPGCMTGLPSGRVALAGTVTDPFTVRTEVVGERETEARDCPAGTHGPGQTWVREIMQDLDGRGDPVGTPRPQAWELQVDDCTGDYTEWEFYRQECTFWASDPHNAMLTGQQVWRRLKSVTADGTSWGGPEFVSTTCWDNPNPAPPVAVVTSETVTETREKACAAGEDGAIKETRQATKRLVRFPWDDAPTETVTSATEWEVTSDTCAEAMKEVCYLDDPLDSRLTCKMIPQNCNIMGKPGEKRMECSGQCRQLPDGSWSGEFRCGGGNSGNDAPGKGGTDAGGGCGCGNGPGE